MKKNNPYIFDIQRFSIHDGPGIRTVLFTKGCPLRCRWCQNPESQKIKQEIGFYYENCIDCNKCVEICPADAIDSITRISNYEVCIGCGACVDICENNARRIIGQEISEKEIINELLKDTDFYTDSDGGITFSGGEPFIHPEFLSGILPQLKKYNIHINIETCGQFNYEKIEELLPYIDLIYYDIKHMDNKIHKEYTGHSNDIILSNFKKLNSVFKNIQVRIPLIPGVNDDSEHIRTICNYLLKNDHKSVHLLAYHSMGNSKAVRIDHKQKIFKIEKHTKKEINSIKEQFHKFGIQPITYD